MRIKVLLVFYVVIFYSCNNDEIIIADYHMYEKSRKEHLDSAIYYDSLINKIYGTRILRLDLSIDDAKFSEMYQQTNDPYFMKCISNLTLYEFCDSMLLVTEKKLPIKMQDSIKISILIEDIEYLKSLKSDSVINSRQIEIKSLELQELKNKKYE